MSEMRKYRQFTPDQKAEIALAGLSGDRAVRDVCREYEIAESAAPGVPSGSPSSRPEPRSGSTSPTTTDGRTPASATGPRPRSPAPGKIRRHYTLQRPDPSTPTGSTSGIDRPGLVLAADRDEIIPLDLSIALYRTLTHPELAVIPAAGHISPSDPRRAGAFAAAIADFARRQTDT